MAVMRVTFPARNATAFVNEVKERVAAYFAATGKSDKGGWRMLVKSAVLMGAFFALYFVLILTSLPAPAVAGVALAMGILLAGVGFCISHDALHGAYSENPTVNKIVGYSFDVVGANGYMWQITHNVIHHTYTNIEGIDEDLAVSPLIRLSPSAPYAWYHRFQHLYAWVLYSFSTIFWVFAKDFKYFFARELGPYKDRKHARSEWVRLWVFKAIYYGWSVAIPLAMPHISLLEYLAVFFTVHLTGGLILGVVFQLAHVVEHIDYPEPEHDGAMPDDWMVHELRTTSDFGRSSRLLRWYVGGLNFQVEHHLFPKVCSLHYPAIAPIVEETARKHGLPYHHNATFWGAVGSHFRMLKRFSKVPAGHASLAQAA
ncbi:MAG: acyl-CoA desaturase [Gemmatimonadales bacterium]